MSKAVAQDKLPDAKRRLLDSAMVLMLRQGFTATTVDEICTEAKLTKGSFFHYFKSKDEIGEAAIDHYCCAQQTQFQQAAFNRVTDPLERLHGFLNFIAEGVRTSKAIQGCLLGNLTQELAQTHPKIRCQCEARFGQFIGMISGTLLQAKQVHKPAMDFDPESVGAMFVSLLQGSMLLAKARQDKRLVSENLAHFRAYIDTLFTLPRRR